MKREEVFEGEVLRGTTGKYTVRLHKDAQNFVLKANKADQKRILKALALLSSLEGDICPLRGLKGVYRLKFYHYRVLFRIHNNIIVIEVVEINTRGDIY